MAKTQDSLRNSMRRIAGPYLKPGETVQYVFPAQTTSGWASLIANAAVAPPLSVIGTIAGLFGLGNRSRIFVVTDQRILVLDAGWMPPGGPIDWVAVVRAVGVVTELPRSTRLGPPTGRVYVINVKEGEKLRVFSEWFEDVEKADAERPGR